MEVVVNELESPAAKLDEQVRRCLEELGRDSSSTEVARLLGESRQAWHRWTREGRWPTARKIQEWLEAIRAHEWLPDVSLEWSATDLSMRGGVVPKRVQELFEGAKTSVESRGDGRVTVFDDRLVLVGRDSTHPVADVHISAPNRIVMRSGLVIFSRLKGLYDDAETADSWVDWRLACDAIEILAFSLRAASELQQFRGTMEGVQVDLDFYDVDGGAVTVTFEHWTHPMVQQFKDATDWEYAGPAMQWIPAGERPPLLNFTAYRKYLWTR